MAVPLTGPALRFALPNVRYGEADVSLEDYRSQAVVVNFWAAWCVPCRQELPMLAEAERSLRGRIAFIGVNTGDDRDEALEQLRFADTQYQSGFDPFGDVRRAYGIFGLPATVFLSADGGILDVRIGAMTRDELAAAVFRLFDVQLS